MLEKGNNIKSKVRNELIKMSSGYLIWFTCLSQVRATRMTAVSAGKPSKQASS